MSAFPALALAAALTYVIGDIYRPHIPLFFALIIDAAICFAIFRVTNRYLKHLKE